MTKILTDTEWLRAYFAELFARAEELGITLVDTTLYGVAPIRRKAHNRLDLSHANFASMGSMTLVAPDLRIECAWAGGVLLVEWRKPHMYISPFNGRAVDRWPSQGTTSYGVGSLLHDPAERARNLMLCTIGSEQGRAGTCAPCDSCPQQLKCLEKGNKG